MNSNFLKSTTLIIALSLSTRLVAQEAPKVETRTTTTTTTTLANSSKPFEKPNSVYVGVEGGVFMPTNFFGRNNYFTKWDPEVAYSVFIKKQFFPGLGLKLGYLGGSIRARNGRNGYYSVLKSSVPWAAYAKAEAILGNVNWYSRQNFILPYVTVGGGIWCDEVTFTVAGTGEKEVEPSRQHAFIPVGAGFKFVLANNVNLDFGCDVNIINVGGRQYKHSQLTDVVHTSTFAHLGVEFALGKRSRPSMALNNPASDFERDYVSRYDELKGRIEGIESNTSKQLAEGQETTAKQLANAQATLARQLQAMRDSLAKQSTQIQATKSKLEKAVLTAADQKIVKEAVTSLKFELGSATIDPSSYESLNRLAELLAQKGFKLKLAGHTDNVGGTTPRGRKKNQVLSLRRAQAVRAYLIRKGVNPDNIMAEGYGQARPIASNATAEGRQQNRRVEFVLQ